MSTTPAPVAAHTPQSRPYALPFTQFLMPHGRQESVSTSVGDAEFEQWKKIRERGFRLTREMLSDWKTISMCIEDRELGDFDCCLAKNGPDVPDKLSEMLLRYDDNEAAKFIKSRKNRHPIEPLLWEEPGQTRATQAPERARTEGGTP